jgi:hypothetical protein
MHTTTYATGGSDRGDELEWAVLSANNASVDKTAREAVGKQSNIVR